MMETVKIKIFYAVKERPQNTLRPVRSQRQDVRLEMYMDTPQLHDWFGTLARLLPEA